MTNAGVGDTAAARERSDKSHISKKKEIKPTAKKNLPQKFDFLKWLEMYAAGVQSEKLVTIIPQLSNELQNLASELVIASGETTVKPTAKIKIERLPIDFVRIFRTKVRNPFYLIFLLCNSSTDVALKKLIIQDLSKVILGKDDIEYLLNKMGGIKDSNTQQVVWNEFLTCGILQQEAWSVYQLKILDWGLSHGLRISKPNEVLIGLRSASDQFKQLETPQRNRIYRKLLELDLLTFLAFLIHISSESLSAKFVEQIVAKRSKLVLLTYFENRQSFNGPWLAKFETQFISPILKSTLDGIMRFEDLLPFLVKQSYFSHLIPSETLQRAVSRSFRRNDEYSSLLEDVRVSKLEAVVESLTNEIDKVSKELRAEKSQNIEHGKRIKDFELAIENYETRLRSQMKSENVNTDAMEQSAKAEVIKSLVESLDHLLQDTGGLQLERVLQKSGILRSGQPGQEFAWDSELCETLTGEAMERGIVVRSGYTWLVGEKKVLIRRVLLKSK
jgi:hypothetical protein